MSHRLEKKNLSKFFWTPLDHQPISMTDYCLLVAALPEPLSSNFVVLANAANTHLAQTLCDFFPHHPVPRLWGTLWRLWRPTWVHTDKWIFQEWYVEQRNDVFYLVRSHELRPWRYVVLRRSSRYEGDLSVAIMYSGQLTLHHYRQHFRSLSCSDGRVLGHVAQIAPRFSFSLFTSLRLMLSMPKNWYVSSRCQLLITKYLYSIPK